MKNVDYLSTKKIGNYSYNITNLLGKGTYSEVFLGINEQNNVPIAIKVISQTSLQDEYVRQMFSNEIAILEKLSYHKNIVKLYDVIYTANNAYIIQEYCNQGDLETYIKKKKSLSENEAIRVLQDIANGYKELLKYNMIHRDLKPANIFVCDDIFKIGDFGFVYFFHLNKNNFFNSLILLLTIIFIK